jgi:hypothetical protein
MIIIGKSNQRADQKKEGTMKVKFVRWLGAFRSSGQTLESAVDWEISQRDRQVAAEPLRRGCSLIRHALIGLVMDHDRSVFVCGWEQDAWTEHYDGVVKTSKRRKAAGKRHKSADRLLAAVSKLQEGCHAEAIFDYPRYIAVAVKKSAPARVKKVAATLASEKSLPLVEVDTMSP